jgi:hypothetical protein
LNRALGTLDGAAVEELDEQPRAVRVHRAGQLLVDGHDRGQVAADRVRRQQAGVVDRGCLDDDQPGAAAGACLVVGDQVVGRKVVVDQARLVRRRDDPVRELHRADVQRREERVQHLRDARSSRPAGTR